MKEEEAKIGMRVRLTGHCIYGPDCHKFDRQTGQITHLATTITAGRCAHVRLDGTGARHLVAFKFLQPVEESKKNSTNARILTEKVMVGDVPCRRILGFEGIRKREELPEAYIDGELAFRYGGIEPHQGHFNFDGREFSYCCNSADRRTVYMRVPQGDPKIEMGGYGLILHEDDIWPESSFQAIVTWMKRAGARLAKIRKEEREAKKAAWSGKEEVEI